ncbi:MAG: hypothetical protein Unbinned7015contig1001_9 [Prokaryotic dsDNA virus sp.]|nr:MAG: hypothetical protein Unbinned7015contig1001_9 [Prokaryotic dsDNA virus sp.]|tara:strand:- start:14565 stop:15191 length:627 start_codon:yes stop_codon:yes gene_type:complete
MTETETETPETNNEGQVADSLLTGQDAGQQPQEQQPQEAPAQQEQPAEVSEPEGAPESYEFQAIEGADLEIDSAPVQAFSEAAKELGLTQDQAQSVLNKVAPALRQQNEEYVNNIRSEWVEAVKADPEIGGDKLQENLGKAVRVLDAYGSPELNEILGTSGLGDNLSIIKFLNRVYHDIGEDRFLTGSQTDKEQPFSAQDFYNNSKMN